MNILALYDPDPCFAEALASGLKGLSDFDYDVYAFTSPAMLESFTRNTPPITLLVNRAADSDAFRAEKKLYLSESAVDLPPDGIYKYQSVVRIAREILEKTGVQEPLPESLSSLKPLVYAEVKKRLSFENDLPDDALKDLIREVLNELRKTHPMNDALCEKLSSAAFFSLRGLDVLSLIMEDPDVTEIMVNGPDHIFIEKHGKISEFHETFISKEKLNDCIQQIASRVNRRVNEASPMADARLADGSRVNLVLSPAALDGPYITIRRFPKEPVTMRQLIEWKSISAEAAGFLKDSVEGGKNIFISGANRIIGLSQLTFRNQRA